LAENIKIIQKKRKIWWRGEGSEGEVVEGANLNFDNLCTKID
jgi:hypothetical protein